MGLAGTAEEMRLSTRAGSSLIGTCPQPGKTLARVLAGSAQVAGLVLEEHHVA